MRHFSAMCVYITLAGIVSAQTAKTPVPAATAPCDPSDKVPNGLLDITEVLGICPEVGHLAAQAANGGVGPLDAVIADPTLMADQFKAQAYINFAIAHLSNATAKLSRLAVKKENTKLSNQTKVQIATAIIGIAGGVIGGGLHLVNNPQVGHAASLIGIGAGATGGGLGIYAALTFPPKDTSTTPSLVIKYGATLGHNNINTISEDPDELADVVSQMADQIEKLQMCVINRSTCQAH
jgi:hypothetical protein